MKVWISLGAVLMVLPAVAAPTPAVRLPTAQECPALPAPRAPYPFARGEQLEFDVDAVGANAAKMKMRIMPPRDGMIPLEVTAVTNTFFSKVRRVNAKAVSYLNPRTLRPVRYTENSIENEVQRTADVAFNNRDKTVKADFTIAGQAGVYNFKYANEALDVAGATFLMRQMPLTSGQPICFDAYGIRRMWRVTGKVVGIENVSLPVGEFKAWHLAATAIRIDQPNLQREVHVWISDDERRLPLAAMGVIDLGVIRATLTAYSQGKEKRRAEGTETLKW